MRWRPNGIDAIFEATAERQRNDELLFSTVADIMGSVACRIHPSVHAAYQARVKEMNQRPEYIVEVLKSGAARCKVIAEKVMDEVRTKIGVKSNWM